MSPLPFLAPNFYCRACCRVMGYPFGQAGSAVLAVSPPGFLCNPSLLDGSVARERGGLDRTQALLSNSYNTSVLSTLFFITNTKHSTKRTTVNKISSATANTRTRARRIKIVSMSTRSSKANRRMLKDILSPQERVSVHREKRKTLATSKHRPVHQQMFFRRKALPLMNRGEYLPVTSPSATQHCWSSMEAASSRKPAWLWVRIRTDTKDRLWLRSMFCQLCLAPQLKRGGAAPKGTEPALLTPEHLMTQFRQHGMDYIQMSIQRVHNKTQQPPQGTAWPDHWC